MLSVRMIAPALAFAFIAVTAVFVGWERYTTSNERFCMNCHRQQGNSEFWRPSSSHPADVGCPACHAEAGQFIPRDFSDDPERVNANCSRCHKEILSDPGEEIVLTLSELEFPHRMHVEDIGAVCTDCHANIRHVRGQSEFNLPHMGACLRCHEETKQECSTCHALQTAIYEGTTGWIEDEEPNWMAAAEIGCEGCHEVSEMPGTRTTVADRCVTCHEDESYAEMLPEWQARVRELMDLIEETAHADAGPRTKRAGEILRALRSDRSAGAHNPELAIAVLESLVEQD